MTCPKNHLKMYCRKMGAHSRDEKLLMHFFQDSLAGAAVVWYTNLEASRIRTWKDMITAFLRQYQYNSDMAPDRTQLQNMVKRESESFKEYAQHWRDLAVQVAPPMVEREMITMMVDTLPSGLHALQLHRLGIRRGKNRSWHEEREVRLCLLYRYQR